MLKHTHTHTHTHTNTQAHNVQIHTCILTHTYAKWEQERQTDRWHGVGWGVGGGGWGGGGGEEGGSKTDRDKGMWKNEQEKATTKIKKERLQWVQVSCKIQRRHWRWPKNSPPDVFNLTPYCAAKDGSLARSFFRASNAAYIQPVKKASKNTCA